MISKDTHLVFSISLQHLEDEDEEDEDDGDDDDDESDTNDDELDTDMIDDRDSPDEVSFLRLKAQMCTRLCYTSQVQHVLLGCMHISI